MATARSQEATCRIVKDRTLELETEAGRRPFYNGVVVMEDKILVIDRYAWNLRIYNRHNGKLMYTSGELESGPRDICLISKTEVAVCLLHGTILIISLKSIYDIIVVKRLRTGFRKCFSLAKLNSDQLVFSGRKDDMLCCGVVSIIDEDLDLIHVICKGRWTHIAIKDSTVYISCWTDGAITNGVYAYDVFNPGTHKFLYLHQELKEPWSIMVDRDCLYVCDSNRIHQLTDSGQLVTIHTVSSSPCGIFYDDQQGLLYTTSNGSNVITVYKMTSLHQPGLPIEILNMDERSIQLFEEALKDGEETVYNIRIMVVGHMGVGKTTLVKRLLGEEVNISERHSTEGIDVYVNCCDVSLSTHEWTRRTKDSEQDYRLQRIARVLNEKHSEAGKVADELVLNPLEEDKTEIREDRHAAVKYGQAKLLNYHSSEKYIDQELSYATNQRVESTSHEQDESTSHQQEESSSDVVQMKPNESNKNTIAMIQLLKENVNKIEGTGENSLLTIWDFAGQYAFYTTHQTFLTRRAIYLLVSDASGQVTDFVADDCYFDSKGIMKCQVHDLVEVWLNSIHSCASTPEDDSPPVILVGTHVDQISLKLSQRNGEEAETQNVLSRAVKLNRSTTWAPGVTSANEPPSASTIFKAVKKFVQPRNTGEILEVTTVQSLAGAHAATVDDYLKKHKRWSWFPGRKKKKARNEVMSAPSTEKPGIETVMGVDAENNKRHEICNRYFREIRSYLKDKPTRFHLIDEDFAIDNTVVDRTLEALKRKIIEVASQQPYWG